MDAGSGSGEDGDRYGAACFCNHISVSTWDFLDDSVCSQHTGFAADGGGAFTALSGDAASVA